MDFFKKLYYKFEEWRYERRCLKYLGVKPQKVYVSKETYDELVKIMNSPPNPETQESIKKLLERKAPWDEK